VAYVIALLGSFISNMAVYYERALALKGRLPWSDADEYISLLTQVIMFLLWPVTLIVLCVVFYYRRKEKARKSKIYPPLGTHFVFLFLSEAKNKLICL